MVSLIANKEHEIASLTNASICLKSEGRLKGKRKGKVYQQATLSRRAQSLKFRVKVRVRSQANDHDKQAIGSQRQTCFAEHISPPLATLHLGAPS